MTRYMNHTWNPRIDLCSTHEGCTIPLPLISYLLSGLHSSEECHACPPPYINQYNSTPLHKRDSAVTMHQPRQSRSAYFTYFTLSKIIVRAPLKGGMPHYPAPVHQHRQSRPYIDQQRWSRPLTLTKTILPYVVINTIIPLCIDEANHAPYINQNNPELYVNTKTIMKLYSNQDNNAPYINQYYSAPVHQPR